MVMVGLRFDHLFDERRYLGVEVPVTDDDRCGEVDIVFGFE